jgi:hypothetical protein
MFVPHCVIVIGFAYGIVVIDYSMSKAAFKLLKILKLRKKKDKTVGTRSRHDGDAYGYTIFKPTDYTISS